MPSRDEVLAGLLATQKEILDRLDRMEQAIGNDPWEQEFDASVAAPAAPPAAPPKPPKAPPAAPSGLDPEQQAAWERAHKGLVMEPELEDEQDTFEVEEGSGVTFPTPPSDLKNRWADEAPRIFENWTPDPKQGIQINAEAAMDAYGKAGPLWLAAYAHDWLMGLPKEWRQHMAVQVVSYARKAGMDFGKDVLRASLDEQKGAAYDQALFHADQRPTAHA